MDRTLRWSGFLIGFCLLCPKAFPSERDLGRVDLNRLPITFEVNEGQVDSKVRFLSRVGDYSLFLSWNEAAFLPNTRSTTGTVRMKLARSKRDVEPAGLEPLPAKSNYFLGNDPGKWLSSILTFAQVIYRGVYPGI